MVCTYVFSPKAIYWLLKNSVLNNISNLCLFCVKKAVKLPLLHQQKYNEFYGLILTAR